MKSIRPHNPSSRRRGDAPSRIRLDETDLQVLRLLSRDARMSQRALAREIGMSAPAIAERINRLESAGVIRGYHADLDYSLLSRPMTVVVTVQSQRSTTQVDLAEQLSNLAEVERVDVVTGSGDLQLRLRVRDPEHLNDVLFNGLMRASDEIQHTETHLALITIEPKNFAERVIESLESELARDDLAAE